MLEHVDLTCCSYALLAVTLKTDGPYRGFAKANLIAVWWMVPILDAANVPWFLILKLLGFIILQIPSFIASATVNKL